jgi:adenine phosphoribosyltransferase
MTRSRSKKIDVGVIGGSGFYELAKNLKEIRVPYVVARKIKKRYMGKGLSHRVISITTGEPQTIWLDDKDVSMLKKKRVILVDDVVSTGSTLKGLRSLMKKAGAIVVAEAAVFTEGEEKEWKKIIALGNLPVFTD